MKNLYAKILTTLGIFVSGAYAVRVPDSGSLDDTLGGIEDSASTFADKGIGIAGIILILIGFIVFSMGVYDAFIDEDARQEGKKTKGFLKMIGGALFAFMVPIYKYLTNQ